MDSPVLNGIAGGTIAGLATGVGAAMVYGVRRLSARANDVLLSSAAGIMLAATMFALLAPALEAALARHGSRGAAAAVCSCGMLAGALMLQVLHRAVPHEHFVAGREGPQALLVRRMWLFVLAITLHNLPEGMAVGVGFGAGPAADGMPLAIGIGLQNVPEGLAVAASLTAIGYRPTRAFLLSLGTGLLEGLGAAVGALAAGATEAALPFVLAFAAGAMLFVIVGEIIPETTRDDLKGTTTFALLCGFLAMTALDFVLG